MFWNRGLCPHPRQAVQEVEEVEEGIQWTTQPENGLVEGELYTDGARTLHKYKWLSAATCGFAQVANGKVTAEGYCHAAHPRKTSPVAEMMAIVESLKVCGTTLTIKTDYLPAVQGYRKGKAWCTASSNPFADLWRKIWRKVEDIGEENVHILKVKGHATWKDVDEHRATFESRMGNNAADKQANGSAKRSDENKPVEDTEELETRLKMVCGWIAKTGDLKHAGIPRDTECYDRRGKAKSSRASRARTTGHNWVWDDHKWACDRCKTWTKNASKRKDKCNGSRMQLMLTTPEDVGPNHKMWSNGPLIWCSDCGGWSVTRMQGLCGPCGLPTIAGNNARKALKAGKHPVKGKSLAFSEHIPMLDRIGPRHISMPSRRAYRPGEGIVDPLSMAQIMMFTGLRPSEEEAARVAAALVTQPDVWDERLVDSGDEDDPLFPIDPWC
jgi:ribonuclease HI